MLNFMKYLVLPFLSFFFVFSFAFAQLENNNPPNTNPPDNNPPSNDDKKGNNTSKSTVSLPNPLGITSVPVLIGRIIKGALGIVGSLALLMFVYGGFVWMLSGGNSEKVQTGRKTLVWAAIGLAVIFTSFILVDKIISTLGV